MGRLKIEQRHLHMLLLVLVFVGLVAPLRPGYRAVRTIGRSLPLQTTSSVLYSDNFKLLYDGDMEEAEAMLTLLEAGLSDLQEWLPDHTPRPIVVRLHQSQASLQQALGSGDYAPTLGAYYLGKLELLAPQAWRPDMLRADALAYYALEGPVVHELTHLFLDYQALGQYPIWFSEGLAQYWEMRLRGYVWQEGGSAWQDAPHSVADLTGSFASLPEAVAYQEAFSLVQFLYEKVGDSGMSHLLFELRQGQQFGKALRAVYGNSLATMEDEWRAWLAE